MPEFVESDQVEAYGRAGGRGSAGAGVPHREFMPGQAVGAEVIVIGVLLRHVLVIGVVVQVLAGGDGRDTSRLQLLDE
jgi:hypothetical protein